MDIAELHPRSGPEPDLAAWHEVLVATTAHDLPGDPVPALSDTVADLRNPFASRPGIQWLGRVAGVPAAACTLKLLAAPNDRIGEVDVQVVPQLRRRGLGRAILAAAMDRLLEEGRTVVTAAVAGGTAGPAFAHAMGLREVLSEHRSILRLAGLTPANLDRIVSGTPTGYRLLRWQDRIPEGYAEAYGVAKAAMSDAPMGDSTMQHVRFDTARLRSVEGTMRRRGIDWRVVTAVHTESGGIAALTELGVPAGNPYRATQEDTAVVPAHRGHALGLVVKAEMLRWLAAERPDVAEIQTWNAQSNRHMLTINERLGFRRDREWMDYQADIAMVIGRLGS
ncbi:MAG: GNAT family N-acetyltransferase [Pseudonocardiales bacterium]